MPRKQKQTALITGASSGIGEALAHIFAREGFDLVLVACSGDKLRALARKLEADSDADVQVVTADLARKGAAARLLAWIRETDTRIDVLVNNAGVLEHGAFAELSPAAHQRIIQLNVAGLTDVLAHFVPLMIEQGGGRICNVASIAGFMPVPSLASYAATKAYVLSLSEALGEELRQHGITVTALCPGITATNMIARVQSSNATVAKLPDMMVSDVEEVASEAFRACMKGVPILVPGKLNLATTLAARSTPKWLVRRLSGLLGRSTI